MPRLTARQARFVEEYLVDLNAAGAARRAGYNTKRAEVIGYENLIKPDIRTAIEAAQRERSARTGITADRVVQEIAKIALSNLTDVMTWDETGATLIPSSQLSPDAAAAIAEISDTRTERGVTLKVKLHNKVAALEQLAKHVGLYGGKADGETIRVVWQE